MSTANASSSPGATTNTPDRDRAADSDDSLARKRQRLSEEAEVRIEADEPEDMDDDLNNVIVIEDGFDNDAYSSTFNVVKNISNNISPFQELEYLHGQVTGDVYLDPEIISSFTAWLNQHLDETAHDRNRWQTKYLLDGEFFDALAKFSFSVMNYSDLFDPAGPSYTIQRIAHAFYDALTKFCVRILSIIPKMLEEPLTRRDSVQPTGTGQERFPFAMYFHVLDRALDPSNHFSKMLQNNFGMVTSTNVEHVARLVIAHNSTITSLNAILLSLSVRPRAFTDTWHVILATISIMSRSLRVADAEYHAGDGRTQIDKMYMTIGEYIVPAVCQKHPRALPRDFHTQLTKHVAATLELTVKRRPMASVLDLYRAITQGDNALSCGIVDEPATELKLNEACRNDRATLAELIRDLWLLQVLKGYVSTDILDIKSKGILALRGLLKDSYNAHQAKGSDHPVLQYLARFLRIGNYTEYIFSADSHASLVKECSDVVGFLAATGTYTDHETDLIWRACTTSVEAEFVKASFEVLKAMLIWVKPPQVLHMARKYAQTEASALGPYAVSFLGEAFAHFRATNTNPELHLMPMRIAFDILKRLDDDKPAVATSELRQVASREVYALRELPHGLAHREILYTMCVSEIQKRTKHATSSMELLLAFLQSPSSEEAGRILERLPVKVALDELVHVVRGDVEDREVGSHSTLDSVRIHLELVLRLVGLSEFAEDKELEERLWIHTIGDAAISSLAREHALDCFISTPQHTKNPSSVERLFLRGVDQFLPTMSADCATLRLVAFLRSKVKEAAMALALVDLERILEDQSWQQLLRLTTTTSSDSIAAAGVSSINDILFPGHLPRDDPHVIVLQAAFVRRHIDSLQSLQGDQDMTRRRISIHRGITLLETVHHHSKTFQPKIIGDVHPIELAGSEAADRIEFTVHIHGPQGSPIARTVQALEDCHLVDLGKALQSTSGVANHDLVLNGSLARFEDISSQTLHEAGIKSSSVVSIRPRYTFDCDFSKVFASTSAVESEIRARFSLLESLLDGPEEVAERVYNFLCAVSPPMSTRRHVFSQDVPLEGIFPPTRTWRTLYSIHVLTSHLNECNKLGVADQSFILHGVKVLAGLLMDRKPISGLLLSTCLPGLLNFLQERPHPSPPPPYIEQPKKLAIRLFDIIEEIQMFPSPASVASHTMSVHAGLTKLAYCVILQLARTDGLWPKIRDEERFVSAHKTILLSKHLSVSHTMAPVMCDFVKEKPELAIGPYLRSLVTLLPDAMSREANTFGFFMLFRELLTVDCIASDSDENLRSIIETLVQQMWRYRHTETADNAILDATFADFLCLLNCAIELLKRFKKPLRLGDLAMAIFSRLLFCDADTHDVAAQTTNSGSSTTANLVLRSNDTHDDGSEISWPASRTRVTQSPSRSDSTPTPLYHVQSRILCMEMVRTLCDNDGAYQWLMDRLSHVLEQGPLYSPGAFPTGHFIRAPDACSGLSNLGMTCYMNSLLQQIFSNIDFRHFVFETPTASSEPDLLWHIKKLFAEMQDSNVQVVDTQALAKYLNISVDNQEDVHGFYTIFMSALEQCLPDSTARDTFNRMFSGRLATQVQGSCGHVSSRTEPFSDLSITVQNKASLADSLAEFVQGEPMQGANKYKCLSCDAESGGKLVDAMRRTCLDDVPDHLNVCLKRFTFDMMGQESKNNDFFEFPEEIDLSKYKRQSLEDPNIPAQPDMFKLVGVIVHSGILTFGHYWSYVRLRYPDARVSKWVRLEDGNTRTANGFEEVQQECFGGHNRNHNGYVLFYQRESSFAKSSTVLADLPRGVPPQAGLPPRVHLPDDLYQVIYQDNMERHRVAQPFDEGFYRLVFDIVGQSPLRSASYADSESMDHEQGCVAEGTQMWDSLARLAFDFLSFVLLGERVQNKMLQFVNKFKSLAVQDTKLARCFIARVSADPDFFLRYLDHEDYETRMAVRHLLKDCLFCIKDPEPQVYAFELKRFVRAHASLLKVMGPRYSTWFDYFSMAYDVQYNGTLEMHVVLNAGYLPWILEVAMDAPLDPQAHQDQQVLLDAYRKKRVEYWPLFQFLHLFLEQGGAFKDIEELDPGRSWHPARPVMELTGRVDAPRLTWMALAARDNSDPVTVQSTATAKLVHVMAESDQRFWQILVSSLLSCFRMGNFVTSSMLMMTNHLIAAMGDTHSSTVILTAMIEALKHSDRLPPRLALSTFEDIMGYAPRAVLRTLPSWAPEFLLPDNKITKLTQKWLLAYLFVATPLNKIPGDREVFGTVQDILRSQTIRHLFSRCKGLLRNAHDVDESIVYAQMNAVLEEAFRYLSNLTAMCASIFEEAWRSGEQVRLAAERAIIAGEEPAEAEAENQTSPAPEVAELSDGMREEYKHAREAQQALGSLLQDLQSPWLEDDEQVEDEGDSSAFEETEDEA